MKNLIYILLLIIFAGIVSFALKISSIISQNTQPIACTIEAKMCPDGSYVARTGPNCEFSACPNSTSQRIRKKIAVT